MRVAIVTLFPELFEPMLSTSFVGKARASGALEVHLEPLREHGLGKHRAVDDTPYGGGSGMVLRVDVVVSAIERAEAAMGGTRMQRILLAPTGERFAQGHAAELAQSAGVVFVCGRYEGFDDRVNAFVDRILSLGDFVLSGGEVAAMAMLEAAVRLLPGVLGNESSSREESFSREWDGLLEYPQFTRPASFRGHDVPEVLKGGDHELVRRWRREQALERTRALRPDILNTEPGANKDKPA